MDEKSAERVVATWPEMRAEPKRAWEYLWEKNGRRPGELWVSDRELGELQGTSDRAGRRQLKSLARHRLIIILERLPNRTRVYLCEPREVVDDRPAEAERPLFDSAELVATSSGQTQTKAAAETAPERAPDPAPRLRTPSEERHAQAPSPLDPLEPLLPSEYRRAPLSHAAPDAAPRPSTPPERSTEPPPRQRDPDAEALSEILRQKRADACISFASSEPTNASPPRVDFAASADRARLCLPGAPDRAARREEIVERIRRRVADPKLRDKPMLRFADAIVDGLIPERELDSLLSCLDQQRREKTLKLEPWMYFVGTGRKIFKRFGQAHRWPREDPDSTRAPP
jgi:hypothetical protein